MKHVLALALVVLLAHASDDVFGVEAQLKEIADWTAQVREQQAESREIFKRTIEEYAKLASDQHRLARHTLKNWISDKADSEDEEWCRLVGKHYMDRCATFNAKFEIETQAKAQFDAELEARLQECLSPADLKACHEMTRTVWDLHWNKRAATSRQIELANTIDNMFWCHWNPEECEWSVSEAFGVN